MFEILRSILARGSPPKSDSPDHSMVPVAPEASTWMSRVRTDSPLECPSSPLTIIIDSPNQVEPETLPRIPVTGFTVRSSLTSVSRSEIHMLDSSAVEVTNRSRAAVKSESPMKAETRIFPLGTVTLKCPLSSACVEAIGIQ